MSMAERSMGLGLRALGRLAGSDVVDRLGVRKPAEKVLYRATRDGFKAAGAAGRTFKSVNGNGKPKRLSTTASKGLFDLTPTRRAADAAGVVQGVRRRAAAARALAADTAAKRRRRCSSRPASSA